MTSVFIPDGKQQLVDDDDDNKATKNFFLD